MSSVWGSPNATPIETPFTTVCPASGKGEAVFSTTALAKGFNSFPAIAVDDCHELVAADAGDEGALAEHCVDSAGGTAKKLVAGTAVAERGVHRLEVVDVGSEGGEYSGTARKGRPPAMTLCNSARLGSPVKAS